MKDRTMKILWAILLFLKEIGSLQFKEERKFDCSDQKLEILAFTFSPKVL